MTACGLIFYITGAGGDHRNGLGAHLASLNFAYGGLSLSAGFVRHSFDQKLAIIRSAIEQIDRPEAAIIANSMGAYYLLHSFIDRQPFSGRVLLLSPVLGAASHGFNYSRPPMAANFANALQKRRLPKPARLEIATGMADTSCDYCQAEQVAAALAADQLTLVEGQGHTLDHTTVRQLVERFLHR